VQEIEAAMEDGEILMCVVHATEEAPTEASGEADAP
jgi:hypothetical protein